MPFGANTVPLTVVVAPLGQVICWHCRFTHAFGGGVTAASTTGDASAAAGSSARPPGGLALASFGVDDDGASTFAQAARFIADNRRRPARKTVARRILTLQGALS